MFINSIYSDIVKCSKTLGCITLINESLKKHTSFKIGGPADIFIYINNLESAKILINLINKKNLPFFILGNGTNLLVSDEGYRGIILSFAKCEKFLNLENENIISCSSGIPLARVCVFALQNSLSGLEFAWGIPGSCGGAVFMNAGAYGNDISDIIISCSHLDETGTEKTLKKEALEFSYRKSFYSNKSFAITSLKFKLKRDDPELIRQRMYENILKRKSKQPLEYPNAGSIFKRPEGHFTGALIEKCGLKGTSFGGAAVSEKHSGFIINKGGAKAKDVIDLIKFIREKVYNKFGVTLECEIRTLGNIEV